MRAMKPLSGMLLVMLLALAPGPAPAEMPAAELARVRQDLRAANDEWRHQESAFRQARTAGQITGAELDDFAAFVAGLRTRLLQQCEVSRNLGGEDAIKGFDCLVLAKTESIPTAPVSTWPARTEEEKRAAANARMDALEAEIDEALLKRQQELRRTASNKGGGSGAGGGGSAAGSRKGAAQSASRRDGRQNAKATDSGNARSWTRPPEDADGEKDKTGETAGAKPKKGLDREHATAAGPPGKLKDDRTAKRERSAEDSSDDDVIARQLREAAEKETDEILKEKLWEEYRKYKRSQK